MFTRLDQSATYTQQYHKTLVLRTDPTMLLLRIHLHYWNECTLASTSLPKVVVDIVPQKKVCFKANEISSNVQSVFIVLFFSLIFSPITFDSYLSNAPQILLFSIQATFFVEQQRT